MQNEAGEKIYQLYCLVGDPASVKAKLEMVSAGMPVEVHMLPIKSEKIGVLDRKYGITRFPAVVRSMSRYQGLVAVRSLIQRWVNGS
ncbi:hypothetical protein KKF82_05085 [Patescibacteria group bacterium]|nr:hypothetical protein [Patescibacteria group bacterium]